MKRQLFSLALTLSFAVLFQVSNPLHAQDQKKKYDIAPGTKTLFQHFYGAEDFVPTFKINTSVKELMKTKSRTEEYYIPGTITMSQADGEDLAFDMEIKVRGNTRKKVCRFPPFKINFKASALHKQGFHPEVDKLKLVMQCETGDRSFQQLLREMLIYDLYEQIDTNSMRVKLIKAEFYEDGELKEELNAFIVEDEEEYANRKDARIIEKGRINANSLPKDQYYNLVFFQYMISNCDWSVANKHNIEIVALNNPKKMVAVPYDFDYAGFVDNSYAVPPDHFPIESVTQRYMMMKREMTDADIDETIAYFQSMKDTFISVCQNFPNLDERTIKNSVSSIEGFYKDLENRKRIGKSVKPK